MKKTYVLILLAAMACLMAACTKESGIEKENDANPSLSTITYISASVSENETKGNIDNTTGSFTWAAGDQVAVYANGWKTSHALTAGDIDSQGYATFSFDDLVEGDRANFALFPAGIQDDAHYTASSFTVNLPSSYALSLVSGTVSPCPLIASNTPSARLEFKQLCGILRLNISNIPSGTSYIKVDFNGRKVSGAFSVASTVTPGTSSILSVAGIKGTDDYIKITGFTSETEATVNIPIPVGTAYQGLIVLACDSDDKPLKAQAIPFSYTAARAHGVKKDSPLNLGVFSRQSGKYVVFAPGNLQATTTDGGANWTWHFAATQYESIGNASGNNKVNGGMTLSVASGTVDLFGWSTDVNTYYGIWNNTTPANYSGSFVDWGTNSIDNYAPGTWKTPSGGYGSEFNYIFGSRSASTVGGTPNARYTLATVNGINGIILFPDTYSHPGGVTTPTNINTTTWPHGTNPYSLADWALMESAGCVFLPYTGIRTGGHATLGRANYWSRTTLMQDGIATINAYGVTVKDGETQNTLHVQDSDQKHLGRSVRMIHDLN